MAIPTIVRHNGSFMALQAVPNFLLWDQFQAPEFVAEQQDIWKVPGAALLKGNCESRTFVDSGDSSTCRVQRWHVEGLGSSPGEGQS